MIHLPSPRKFVILLFACILYIALFVDVNYHVTRFRFARTLHTFLAPGRLGNRVFQNLAISLLAEKFDVKAHYDMAPEFAALGLRLFTSGRQLLDGPERPLSDAVLQGLLSTRARVLRHQLHVGPTSYFQTPWFAKLLRHTVLPSMRGSIEDANPWRNRIGRNNDTCLHLRLGNGPRDVDDSQLSPSYFPSFSSAVGPNPAGRVFIATDNPSSPGVAKLVTDLRAELLSFSVVQTVQFLSTCGHLVLSDGTFSWLIGALALNASSVHYVPRGKNKWHGDIFVFEDWVRLGPQY